MSLRRKRPATPVCCGAEVDDGVQCPGCGRVAGRRSSGPLAPATACSSLASGPSALTPVPKPRRPQKPAGVRRPDRPRKRLRARNPERMAKRHAEDFGPLAVAVRGLTCAVVGCDRTPCDPAHVVSRGTAGAWIAKGFAGWVGNLAPLCRGHHTGMPGFRREEIQHQAGVRAFEQHVGLAVKLPGVEPRRVDTLAEVAAAIGEWFRAGAGELPEAPC